MQKVSQKCKEIHFRFWPKAFALRYYFLVDGNFIKILVWTAKSVHLIMFKKANINYQC